MHPRATAPSDRHTARAGVFSRRRLLAGPRMHTEAEELLSRCDRSGGKPPRQVKSSQVTVVDQNQTTHDYMYTKAEMKCQVKSSRYPHGEHGARDLSAWGSALPGAPPVGNPWQ